MKHDYSHDTIVHTNAAYRIHHRSPRKMNVDNHDYTHVVYVDGVTPLYAEEILALKTDDPRTTHLRTYKISSVVSYSLLSGDCPIKALQRSMSSGDRLHFIFGLGACLTSHKREPENAVEVELGMLVKFEGRLFRIIKAPNDNLDLKEVEIVIVGDKMELVG